jgi:hypothetical protein
MTAAERMRRYRLKHGVAKPTTKPKPDAPARSRIAALEAELAEAMARTKRVRW